MTMPKPSHTIKIRLSVMLFPVLQSVFFALGAWCDYSDYQAVKSGIINGDIELYMDYGVYFAVSLITLLYGIIMTATAPVLHKKLPPPASTHIAAVSAAFLLLCDILILPNIL